MKSLVLSLVFLVGTAAAVWANPITFEATVNSPRVALDEALQLTLTITGINKDLDPISLPTMAGFTAKYLGPSTSVSIVNGEYHSERSFIYDLFPNKVGHFQIPSITATIDGQTYTTKPIDIDVFESSSQTQASGPADNSSQVPTLESLKDKIFVHVAVSPRDIYLNERVPVDIELLVKNGVPLRDIQFPQFDKSGFIMDDFQKPEQGAQVVNGVRYDTVDFKTYIYPNRLGDITLGPAQIQGNVLYKTTQNNTNPFGEDDNFFGGNFFNGFFDSYATRPLTITSQPVTLHVSPLPQEDRPADFSGAIGRFDFQASVSPTQVRAGDPLTLKMSVQGSGNFKDVTMPSFQGDGFKSYDPQIKSSDGEKTAEQVIIPTSDNIKEVPALHFSYFDPSAREYKTVTQGPFAIQVSAPSPDQQFKAVGFTDVTKEAPVSGFAFGKILKDFYKILLELARSVWFWVVFGLIVIAAGSFFAWQRFQDRLQNDPAFARRLKAGRQARQVLSGAEAHIAKGQAKDFYGLLSKALRDYLANKWHQPPAALSVKGITDRLKAGNIDPALIHAVQSILEQADLISFAGAGTDAAQMRSDLAQAQNLINQFEKVL